MSTFTMIFFVILLGICWYLYTCFRMFINNVELEHLGAPFLVLTGVYVNLFILIILILKEDNHFMLPFLMKVNFIGGYFVAFIIFVIYALGKLSNSIDKMNKKPMTKDTEKSKYHKMAFRMSIIYCIIAIVLRYLHATGTLDVPMIK